MPTLKKVYTESYRSGFYHPISILILALITLTVALAIFANSGFFSNKNVPAPNPTPQPPPKSSPKTSPSDDLSSKASAKDETTSWKTYTNKKYKYSLKVPQNNKLLTTNLTNGDCIDANDVSNTLEIAQNMPKYCGFLGEQLPSTESDLAVIVFDSPVKDIYNVLGPADQKLTVSGVAASKYKFTEKSELPNIQATRIYINHTGKTYLIFLKQTNKQGNYDKSLDQILSTFQFTN